MNQKRNMKEKGITLIALVITIIVLLILAGVTINMVLGEDGILQRAENAREQQEKAQDMENIRLAMAEIKIDEMSKESPKHLKTILENTYGYENARVIESETGYTVVLNGRTYTVGKDGAVTYVNGATSTVPTTTSAPTASPTPEQNSTVNVTWEGTAYTVPKGISCVEFMQTYAESSECDVSSLYHRSDQLWIVSQDGTKIGHIGLNINMYGEWNMQSNTGTRSLDWEENELCILSTENYY